MLNFRNEHYKKLIFCLLLCLTGCTEPQVNRQIQMQEQGQANADVIIVGAGISGLSAAVEMGRRGLKVLVLDMSSVAGGHAVLAGGVALVDTPVQAQAGIKDSPDQAYRDWMAWTEDGNAEWTRYYAEQSREMIYDWVKEMGVEFVRVIPSHGNSVPRFHFTKGRAVHLVLPIFRTALKMPNVSFLWNTRAEKLLSDDQGISGLRVKALRSGETRSLFAANVVLATGGFESDVQCVLANWTPGLPRPDRLLIGSAISATGSGHDMATEAGAALIDTDRHYIYINGMTNPRDPTGSHSLSAANDHSLWVNAKGQRFTNEMGFDKDILVDLLQQTPASYWMLFDEAAREDFGVRGAAWLKNPGHKESGEGHPILDDEKTVKRASSLSELAAITGLPADALAQSVERYNQLIDLGEDKDFQRFTQGQALPRKIAKAPFYALQMYPVTRKNMGGVAIDRQARVLNDLGQVFPGLYAVGELTGSVGINGKHGLDGMFLGPAILTGRLAGISIADKYRAEKGRADPALNAEALIGEGEKIDSPNENPLAMLNKEDLKALLATPREGYWHFDVSHQLVLERAYACTQCHSAQLPFSASFTTQGDPSGLLAQSQVCTSCH